MFIDFMKKYYLYIIVVVITIIGIIPTYFQRDNDVNPYVEPVVITEDEEVSYIYVDIKGNVLNPGVYKLETNTRLFQLIELAGGLLDKSDTSLINLSVVLNDQQIVYIPEIGEEIPEVFLDEIEDVNNEQDGKININKATKSELTQLPGIGEVTAQNIIDYRNENGGFERIEDIKNVTGIGDTTFENIKEFITT